jgi:hypothetical protein
MTGKPSLKIAPMTENGNNCPTSEHAGSSSGPILARRIEIHSLASVNAISFAKWIRVTTTHVPSNSSLAFFVINDKTPLIVPVPLLAELCHPFRGNAGMTTAHCVRTARRTSRPAIRHELAYICGETRPLKIASIITVPTSRTRDRRSQ